MDGTAALRRLLAGVLLSLLAACSTVRQTDPPQTATEQLLVSHAVEHAVSQLNPGCPKTGTVFLDTQYYDTDNSMVLAKYTIGAVRDRLLRLGCHLAEDRKSADVVVEMRTGAQSIDQSSTLFGIPSIPIPIPLSGAVSTPEVAFFKVERLIGVSKIALTAIDRSGALVSSIGPTFGESHRKHYVILLVISYSTSDIYPEDQETPPPAVNAVSPAAAAVPPVSLQRATPAPAAAPAEPENHALPGLPQ